VIEIFKTHIQKPTCCSHFLSLFLLNTFVLLITLFFAANSFANDEVTWPYTDGSWTADINGETASVTGCVGTCPVDLVIPEDLGDFSVTGISAYAFESKQLTSVTLPISLTTIGTYAFADNQLTSITFPVNVTSIGAFSFADNQLTSVMIPASVTRIGGLAFDNNALSVVHFLGDRSTVLFSGFSANYSLNPIIFTYCADTNGWPGFAINNITFINDCDGDDVLDDADAFPGDPNESVDTDLDGVGNNADTDDDGDGLVDTDDAFSLIAIGELTDTDGDGAPNECDAACQTSGMSADGDDDNDGVVDADDAFSLISIGELTDTDDDGAPDECDATCQTSGMGADEDDDNDGVADADDAFSLISIGELTDTDSDGAPNECNATCRAVGMSADEDDDNDGLVDIIDDNPLVFDEVVLYSFSYTFDATDRGTAGHELKGVVQGTLQDDGDVIYVHNLISASLAGFEYEVVDYPGIRAVNFDEQALISLSGDTLNLWVCTQAFTLEDDNGDGDCPFGTEGGFLISDDFSLVGDSWALAGIPGLVELNNGDITYRDSDIPISRNNWNAQLLAEDADYDQDGIGDSADTDDDNDGIFDTYELANGLDPFDALDGGLDNDLDGLSNFQEFRLGTDIAKADTDGDDLADNVDNNPLLFDEVALTLYSGQFYTLPDLTDDGVMEVGLLRVDLVDEKVRLEILNGKDRAKLDEVVWADNYVDTTLSLHLIPDMNDNGFDEVGLFGIQDRENNEGKPQVFVRDLQTGNKVGDVYNWVANWKEVSALVLDDISGDGLAEIAIQGRFEDAKRPQLVVKVGNTNRILSTYSYPDLFVSPQYYQHSDINGDGFAEIVTFGRLSKNNKIQAKIASGLDAGNKMKAYNFPDKWDNISWHRLDDSNGDGQDDWGMFGTLREDGRPQLVNKDGVSPAGALRIFAWPAAMQNAQFFRIPDMNNDGVDEVAAAGRRSNNGRYQFQVQDGTDRNVLLANHNLNLSLTDVTYHVLPDLSGDEQVEIGFMGINPDGEYELVIRHGDTLNGEFATLNLGSDWDEAPSITSLGDTDDDGSPNLLVYGQNASGEQLVMTSL
jgi:hypothetical protein